MKITTLMALVLLSVNVAFATDSGASKKGKSKAHTKTASKSTLGTSFRFDGTTLRGKYQTSMGTNATVENDKYLDDLLGGRKSFADREKKENQRN